MQEKSNLPFEFSIRSSIEEPGKRFGSIKFLRTTINIFFFKLNVNVYSSADLPAFPRHLFKNVKKSKLITINN